MSFETEEPTYVTGAVGILAGFVLLYGLLIAQQLLVGVVAALLLLLVYIGWRFLRATERIPESNDFVTVVVSLLAGLVVLYSLLVAHQLLLGAIAALLLFVTYFSWRYLRKVERGKPQT